MKLFTPFTIPQKDNCDLCRIKANNRKAVENLCLDQLFNLFSQITKKGLFRNDREETFFYQILKTRLKQNLE